MTLAQRYVWSGTPLTAGLSPAAAHCAELRSFRRSSVALRSCLDNTRQEFSTTYLLYLSLRHGISLQRNIFRSMLELLSRHIHKKCLAEILIAVCLLIVAMMPFYVSDIVDTYIGNA